MAGPFDSPPFHPFHVSPISIREKKIPGTYRLLHNLSYPFNDSSINANIPQTSKTVSYTSVEDAICVLLTLPPGAYTAKTDIAEAFRLIPLAPSEYHKLGMKLEGKYFFDKCLPMGAGSSCRIFEIFSTAVQYIFNYYFPSANCVHMIDDFFIMAPSYVQCAADLKALLQLCADLGIPMAPNKTTEPSTTTIFLGISLDTVNWTARLPDDKLINYKSDLILTLSRSKITKHDLESLLRKANFAASAVPARPFLRRLIDLLHTVNKPYHFIRLTSETKHDINTWLTFLQQHNGITYFRALDILSSSALHMVSDASKLGFGACFGEYWIQASFPPSWQIFNITVLELYPIFVLLNMFGHHLKNSNILFHCDNSAVTMIINKQSSKDKRVMQILRPLFLLLIKYNIQLKSQHIPGLLNYLPDKISRFQVTPELLAYYRMHQSPTVIPKCLLPGNYALE